jgi:hypothetical protein
MPQAVKVEDTIYLYGQVNHDDGLGEYHASGVQISFDYIYL